MLERIRLATPDEVKEIEHNSNLTPFCKVLKMEEITGVWRVANELDPVHLNGASLQKVRRFLYAAEHLMMGNGVTEYFFMTAADDVNYHKVLEELGAQRLSTQPEYRWRVNL